MSGFLTRRRKGAQMTFSIARTKTQQKQLHLLDSKGCVIRGLIYPEPWLKWAELQQHLSSWILLFVLPMWAL